MNKVSSYSGTYQVLIQEAKRADALPKWVNLGFLADVADMKFGKSLEEFKEDVGLREHPNTLTHWRNAYPIYFLLDKDQRAVATQASCKDVLRRLMEEDEEIEGIDAGYVQELFEEVQKAGPTRRSLYQSLSHVGTAVKILRSAAGKKLLKEFSDEIIVNTSDFLPELQDLVDKEVENRGLFEEEEEDVA